MPPRKKASKEKSAPSATVSLSEALKWLKKEGSAKQIAELARYGITATKPYGVAMGAIKKYAKSIGTDHALALELWETERYEARLLAIHVADPARLTTAVMNRWIKESDSWALVDTACFQLFDRSKHAWGRVGPWSKARGEFQKRAAFALLWALALHDADASDDDFIAHLPTIERASTDERNFVKKGVDMAFRAVGTRSAPCQRAARALAEELIESDDPTAQWLGRSAKKAFAKPLRKKRSKKS